MTLEIPSITVRPENSAPSEIRRLLDTRLVRRRRILQGAVGAAMVLGVGAIDLLPGRNSAHAARRGSHPWEYWSKCSDYNTRAEAWKWCNPDAAHVGSQFCQDSRPGRHRTDEVYHDSCHWRNYNKAFRCTGDNGASINAWIWRRSEGPNTGPRSVKCSDGKVIWMQECIRDTYKSTCRYYL